MSERVKSLNRLPDFPILKIFCSFTHVRRCISPPKFNQFFIVYTTLDPSIKFRAVFFYNVPPVPSPEPGEFV